METAGSFNHYTDPWLTARRARAAGRQWFDIGAQRRVDVLKTAAASLRAREAELRAALRGTRVSEKLVSFHVEHLLHHLAVDDRLERYAREIATLHETPTGVEVSVLRPDGVVLLLPASNQPYVCIMPLASLLLPGNSVVFRSPGNDRTTDIVLEAFHDALSRHRLPTEIVTVVGGSTRDAVRHFMPCDDVNTVVFFGNWKTGQAIAASAWINGKKHLLELEGSDFIVVWKDADVERAAESASWGWLRSTQPCIAPKHVLTHPDVHARFMDRFLSLIPSWAKTTEQDPTEGALTPVRRLDDYVRALSELEGLGRVRSGGYRMDAHGKRDDAGQYVYPTVVEVPYAAVRKKRLDALATEIAYPLIPVVQFAGRDDAVLEDMRELLQTVPFGLRVSIWSSGSAGIEALTRVVGEPGILKVNEPHISAPYYGSAWGGPRRSGGPFGENAHFWEATARRQIICCPDIDTAAATVRAFGLESLVTRAAAHSL